jgi:UDP-N-acetylglucosamine 2-epimerase (non-hydrolysing)
MRLILLAGARPNFMKVAPIIRTIDKHNKASSSQLIELILVHTGQHYDYEMSQVFFQDLDLPQPDLHLGIGSGTHAEQTGKVMIEFEKVLFKENPDLVIVVGDVNSTLAAALAAAKLHIPVAHVEAGIRSYDRSMPEEINRLLTDHISDYLFSTSKYDDENLYKEGISADKIFCVGNIMVDSLLFNKKLAEKSDILSQLNLSRQGYALLTLHRPANVDDKQNFTRIVTALEQIAQRIHIVFPVHPRTRKNIVSFGLGEFFWHDDLRLIEPLGYLDFINLEMNSRFIITDSGGVQVETTALGIPCLTLLDSPVWPITHSQGTNILIDDTRKLAPEANKILDDKFKQGKCPELWDGKTAERIVATIARSREETNKARIRPSG